MKKMTGVPTASREIGCSGSALIRALNKGLIQDATRLGKTWLIPEVWVKAATKAAESQKARGVLRVQVNDICAALNSPAQGAAPRQGTLPGTRKLDQAMELLRASRDCPVSPETRDLAAKLAKRLEATPQEVVDAAVALFAENLS